MVKKMFPEKFVLKHGHKLTRLSKAAVSTVSCSVLPRMNVLVGRVAIISIYSFINLFI